MADCNETIEELERYLDQELPARRVEDIVGHLKSCTDCQGAYEFHADLQRVITIKAQRDELSPGFLDKLRNCLDIDWSADDPSTTHQG